MRLLLVLLFFCSSIFFIFPLQAECNVDSIIEQGKRVINAPDKVEELEDKFNDKNEELEDKFSNKNEELKKVIDENQRQIDELERNIKDLEKEKDVNLLDKIKGYATYIFVGAIIFFALKLMFKQLIRRR